MKNPPELKLGNYVYDNYSVFRLDECPDFWWRFRNPDYETAQKRDAYLDLALDEEAFISMQEIACNQLALLFSDTNFPLKTEVPVDDGGEPIVPAVKHPEDPSEYQRAFDSFYLNVPRVTLFKLWNCLRRFSNWGPAQDIDVLLKEIDEAEQWFMDAFSSQ